jgi:hypothetical protein
MYNEDDLIIGYKMVFGNEKSYFSSDPILLDWPMQHMPVPESMQTKEIN